jgi:hypothetical protein
VLPVLVLPALVLPALVPPALALLALAQLALAQLALALLALVLGPALVQVQFVAWGQQVQALEWVYLLLVQDAGLVLVV